MATTVERDFGDGYTWEEATQVAWNDPLKSQDPIGSLSPYLWGLLSDTDLLVSDIAQRGYIFLSSFETDFGVSDSITKEIDSLHESVLNIYDSYVDYIDFQIRACESLGISDSIEKEFFIPISESLEILSHAGKGFYVSVAESVVFEESMRRVWRLFLRADEDIAIEERAEKVFDKPRQEFFSVEHKGDYRVPTFNNIEPLIFEEVIYRQAQFNKWIEESVKVTPKQSSVFDVRLDEFVQIFVSLQRAQDLAISDMLLSAGDLTLEAFKNSIDYGRPAGFSPWRDFIPGDYEYREAMFRAVLTSKNSDRGLLTNIQAVVDVPDIIDRGSARIEVASLGIRVNFSRRFHIIPEVVLTTKGGVGTPATPTVTDLDINGFNAIMKTPDGAFAEGVFSWAAHGY